MGYAPGLALGRHGLSQLVAAPGPPPARESSPRTPRRSPQTRDCQWSRSPPTRSLHAYDDDATLNI